MKLLLLAFIVQTGLQGALPREGSILPQRIDGDDLGTCSGSAGVVDMQRIMFLENDSVTIDSPKGPLEVSIEGENLIVSEVAQTSEHRQHFSDIDYLVSPTADLDLELKFAYDRQNLLLYWRETFKNRIYRQGIMKINPTHFFETSDRSLVVLCEGRGGRRSEP